MFGADIEFILYNKETRKPMPVCGLVGGTKTEAKKINEDYSCLEDNVALELNYRPTKSHAEFRTLLLGSFDVMKNLTEYKVLKHPEAKFSAEALKTEGADEFGCDEDFSAYSDNQDLPRPPPNPEKMGNWRFAGGHLHLSYDTKDTVPAWVAARFMDLFVAIPYSVHMFMHSKARTDQGRRKAAVKALGENRKNFYGLPGLFRAKPYGMEYRTLSNSYIYLSQRINFISQCMRDVKRVLELQGNSLNDIYMSINWDKVKDALLTFEEILLFELDGTARRIRRNYLGAAGMLPAGRMYGRRR